MVFACTLQQESIPSKVKTDIKTILGSGRPVDAVHYFCESDVPVAKRHELQSWAASNHQIELEIHDGQWLAQELCQRDVFWIAQERLGVSRELFPELGDESYEELRHQWEGRQPGNHAEFSDVVAGLREAASSEGPTQDLVFWLGLVNPEVVPSGLRRHAIYETATASLRGQGTMRGLETLVEEYFVSGPQPAWDSDLEDSAVLLGFCQGASRMGQLAISSEKLADWGKGLLVRLDELLGEAETAGRKANLHFVKGLARSTTGASLESLSACLGDWATALDYAEEAPLLPIGSMNDLITLFLQMDPERVPEDWNERVLSLAERLDALVQKRHGAFASATRCRNRAMALRSSGDLLGAIEQFHRAKIGWFAEETLRGSVLAILSIAMSYHDLGLAFASKYYSLAAAFIAGTAKDLTLRKYVSAALFMAAESDYVVGAWCGFFLLSEVALGALGKFGGGADPDEEKGPVFTTLFHAGIAHALAQHFAPLLRTVLWETAESWGLVDDLGSVFDAADKEWQGKERSAVLAALQSEGVAGAFADACDSREARFLALGVQWSIRWDNSYVVNSVGEHFVAVLQILHADVAKLDLCLLPATMSVSLRVEEGASVGEYAEGDHPGEWSVVLPTPAQGEEFEQAVFAATTWLLACASALPMTTTLKIIEARMEKALTSKTFCARSYEELLETFLNEDAFGRFDRTQTTCRDEDSFLIASHPQLRGRVGPGPGYDVEEEKAAITRRYAALPERIGDYLGQVAGRPTFKGSVAALREKGWKDWHILLALYNALVNHIAGSGGSDGEARSQLGAISRLQELTSMPTLPEGFPIPDPLLSVSSLVSSLRMSMLSTLKGLNLELHGRAFAPEAVERLLSERYYYWDADIEHVSLGF